MADPGSGNLRLNSSSLSAVTQIAIYGGPTGLQTTSGRSIRLQLSNNSAYLVLQLNSNSTNNSSWQQYSGTVTSSTGGFSPGQSITIITPYS
jgi:hypothetical protein